jgi:hypothetical protein
MLFFHANPLDFAQNAKVTAIHLIIPIFVNYEFLATDTPQWRRGPDGKVSLCNACGIRFDKRRREAKAMVGKR